MRYLLTAVLVLVGAAAAPAHFVFVFVADGGAEARLVFGHSAVPDPMTPVGRVEKTTLTARDAAGKETKLAAVTKGDGNFYQAKLGELKPVVVFGTTEAGVTQRGDTPPILSFYYPKVIVGDPFTDRAALGAGAALDIVPVRAGAAVRFRVLAGGKPVPAAEVTVGLPGAEADTEVVKTDKDGLTAGFTATGRYSVAARRLDATAGELAGKKYTAVRHTATVVLDFGKAGR